MLTGCVDWPAEFVERYRRFGYWRGERLGDLLRRPRVSPERTAVVTVAGSRTYGELDLRAERLAAGLHGMGIRAGDRVVVVLPNGFDFVTTSVALFRLGAMPVYALPAHRRTEIEYLARETEAVALIVPSVHQGFDFRALASEAISAVPSLRYGLTEGEPGPLRSLASVDAEPLELEPPDPREVAFFLLSGGTTGMPKLIPRTHDDYAYQLRCTAEVVGADAHTVYLAALPAAHNAALGCPGVLGTLAVGGRVVMAESPSPEETLPLIAAEGVTLTTLMPTFVLLWSEAVDLFEVNLSSLIIEVGGAKLDPELASSAQQRLGCTLTHWFGMAEGVLCCTRPGEAIDTVANTQGRPICPDDELRIVDEHARTVAPGEEGELLVRGPMTLRGYYRAPEYNRIAFTADGFLHTGDTVRLTAAGDLMVTGRIKDVVNRGGEKVSAGEVEERLRAHPAVRDVAIVAMPDPILVERSCAFVVAEGEPPTLPDLRLYLAAQGMADFKFPDRLELVDALERTSLGKVDKQRLRATLIERASVPAGGGQEPVSP
ncbi:MAG TPA: AMP-binding protein [Solirubrobacteraceae bacterium]|nr:AMP-binding protein [Solirubrobacteraceae bacterium]